MASSLVTSTLLFLLLLFVFPQMDEACGAQIELRKLEETDHPDQVTVQRIPQIQFPRRILRFSDCSLNPGRSCKRLKPSPCPIYTRCKPPSSSKGTHELGQ